jgi:dihydroflavonol-4-reductase
MNVIVIGGTGLLGTHASREAARRGHSVTSLSRGGSPAGPEGARHITCDIASATDSDLLRLFEGQDALVYALGLDDRSPLPRPAYEVLHDDHVTLCLRVLRAAKAAGARKAVVLGSYFTSLERQRPELRLAEAHPYARTRGEQSRAVLAESAPGFDTFMLEIPYVIGSLPGRLPPWTFLFDMLAAGGRNVFFFTRGGTAAVTAVQVGQAALGAIERGVGGTAYPLGGINLPWPDLARRFLAATARVKRIRSLPRLLFEVYGAVSALGLALSGKERGLRIARLAEVQYSEAYLDPDPSMKALGYGHADYDLEFRRMAMDWEASRARPRETGARV